jgi:hypothetical protein
MGKGTDTDNIIARCAAYRDGVVEAGLLADDGTMEQGRVEREWLPRSATAYEEYVVLTFEPLL